MATPMGSVPRVTGELTAGGLLVRSITEAVLSPRLVTTALPNREMTATPCGLLPTATGLLAVTVPLVKSISETFLQPGLVTKARLRSASMATARGAGPVQPGLEGLNCRSLGKASWVMCSGRIAAVPLTAPSERMETLLLPSFATTARLLPGSMATAFGPVPTSTVAMTRLAGLVARGLTTLALFVVGFTLTPVSVSGFTAVANAPGRGFAQPAGRGELGTVWGGAPQNGHK